MNKQHTITIGIIGCIIGLAILIGGSIKLNNANKFLQTIRAGADMYGYDKGTYRSIDAWNDQAKSGKIIMGIGGGLTVIFGVFVIVGVCLKEQPKSNEVPHIDNAATDITESMKKLNELHAQGFVSDEEFEKKRKDIIDRL